MELNYMRERMHSKDPSSVDREAYRRLEEENRYLLTPPEAKELDELVKNLPKGKSLEEDGVSAEVLQQLWSKVRKPCSKYVEAVWTEKRIS
ncbi:hypothetical protein R1sor_015812 [Riccia sorocarpa]|uniref:Uncharacterized protein n=1 Tax=Riccia sorocarpa TaxID=122646 RepID=A0ABD3HDM1_9MARC